MAFQTDLSPGCLGYLKELKKQKKSSEFINKAIESYYFQMSDPKSYWMQIIKNNYYFMRRLVRKAGRENGKGKMQ
jgi:hypothetical protein